jgi:CheY-like chemotaxis protein
MSVAKLILDAVHLARAGGAVSIGVDIADDLWSVEVDAGQIGQVFHNILLNAKQAMRGCEVIDVRAENVVLGDGKALNSGAHVRISISDYGCGIPADILPRIFDPYFTTKPSGSGLGLATASAIVSRHGGRLSVESKYGDGTVFVVDLPASFVGDEPASKFSSASETPVRRPVWNGTGKLLVMDDKEAVRMLLAHSLITLGYDVLSARDGAEAIDLYEAAKASGRGFDAVLLELTASNGTGGLETARRLKQLDPAAKLIASSGNSDAPVMSRVREYGFDDVLPKLWAVAELSDVFRRVLAAIPVRATE